MSQNDVNNVIGKMQMIKFRGVFEASLEVIKREPVLLILLFLAPMLVNGVLEGYVYPPVYMTLSNPWIFSLMSIVFGIVAALVSFFGVGLLFRATSHVFEKKSVDVRQTFDFVKDNYIEAIKLAINLFIYTGAWIIVVYSIVTSFLMPIDFRLSTLLFSFLPLVGIVYLILFFKKIVNSSMSYAVFWSSDKPDAEKALKGSLDLCDNLTWTIFGNYVLMGLVGAVASFIIIAVFGAILMFLGKGAAAITSAIALAVVGTFYAVFQYCLKAQVEKFRGLPHL